MLLFQFVHYLALNGESADLFLRKHLGTIYNNVEDSPGAGDQFRFYVESLVQFIRQTGGLGFVISLSTIMNSNLH